MFGLEETLGGCITEVYLIVYVVIPILFLILTYVFGFCEALFVFGILGLIIKHRKEMKEWTDKLSRRTPTDTDYQSNTSELSPDEGSFIGIIK